MNQFIPNAYTDLYRDSFLRNLPYWLTQDTLYGYLDKLPDTIFSQENAGYSFEGRPVRLIRAGTGKTTVLLWSQMHGDEPTTTRALLDLFGMIDRSSRTPEVGKVLQSLTLLFIPMLNPDGAERFKRRTASGTDMNRDAVVLRTPEARLLKSVRDTFNADWGFNLHDQEMRHAAGVTLRPSAISLLAPAFNEEKEINEIRGDAIRLASLLGSYAQELIPDCISRYDDTYEHRAFGDSMQRWGTRTVLIEAGYFPLDRTKETIRKAIAVSIYAALVKLAKNNLPDAAAYEALPFNRRYFCEYILRNVSIFINGIPAGVQDVGLYITPAADFEKHEIYYTVGLAELGDCSTFVSSYDIDAAEYEVNFLCLNSGDASAARWWLPPADEPVDCDIRSSGKSGRVLRIRKGVAESLPEEFIEMNRITAFRDKMLAQ
jgi:hypothetical protein